MRTSLPDMVQDTLRQRADAYWKNKDYTHAIADCTTVLTHTAAPHPEDYGVRAKAEAALGQDAAARADFLRALNRDPTYTVAYQGLSTIAEKDHQYGQAVAAFQRAVQAEPGRVEFWGSLGWFQYEDGQIPQAIATDRYAQSMDPNQSWINYNLALCYAVSGHQAQATAAYAAALARGSVQDQQSGLGDLRNALARQPHSTVLQAALMQVGSGQPGSNPHAPMPTSGTVSPPLLSLSAPHIAPALAARLAPEQRLQGCAVRPPAGYTLQQSRTEGLNADSTIFLWNGPQRSDGTRPAFELTVGHDDGRLADSTTSAQAVQTYLAGLADNHSHLKISSISICIINGRPFTYADWSGVGQRTGKLFQGSIYISITSGTFFKMVTHDAEPYSRSTLPLLKAAALTFRQT